MLTQFTIDAARSIVTATHVELVGTLEGVATGGAYKVPARFVYPVGASPVVNAAICEPWNNTNIERFGWPPGNDQNPPIIFSVLGTWMGYEFITEVMGMSGISYEWNKDCIDQQVAAGFIGPWSPALPTVAFDPTWVIAVAEDGYEIMADASTFSRAPAGYLNDPGVLAPPAPPTAATTYMLGFSQTGAQVRGFVKEGYNGVTGPGLGGTFPNNLVHEASFAMGNGAVCRRLKSAVVGLFEYFTDGGETLATEGQFASVATETDIFMAQCHLAKPAAPVAHYNVYEVPGTSHLNFIVVSFQDRWIDQLGQGLNPMVRGLMEALRQKVVNAIAMPPDAYVEGSFAVRATPFFNLSPRGVQIPFGRSTDCWIPTLGEDGNVAGGVRLPHLSSRPTTGPYAGTCVGAPMGIHRGLVLLTQNISSQTRPNAIANAPTPPPIYRQFGGIEMYEGFSAFYETSLIAQLYPEADACGYAALIATGAEYAFSQRWILEADRDAYIAFAASRTQQDLINLARQREVGPQAV